MANNLLPNPDDVVAVQLWEQPTDLPHTRPLLGRLHSSIACETVSGYSWLQFTLMMLIFDLINYFLIVVYVADITPATANANKKHWEWGLCKHHSGQLCSSVFINMTLLIGWDSQGKYFFFWSRAPHFCEQNSLDQTQHLKTNDAGQCCSTTKKHIPPEEVNQAKSNAFHVFDFKLALSNWRKIRLLTDTLIFLLDQSFVMSLLALFYVCRLGTLLSTS